MVTLATTPVDIVRALLEAIARLCQQLDALRGHGIAPAHSRHRRRSVNAWWL
jgi:hypothetical protein